MKTLTLLVAFTAACTVDEMPDESTLDHELGTDVLALCSSTADGMHCGARAIARDGSVQSFGAPRGLGADDLADAYEIPDGGEGAPTIAIVVAHGYSKLESDLAVYRERYGLPPCTIANGCLRVVNADGGSALPPDAPAGNAWTIETMLDVSMASAACPRCKLLVVQGEDSGTSLLEAQHTAVALGADVISNSWSSVEKSGVALASYESYFDHPGVAIFAAAGDLGYNQGEQGPAYPATSAHVFSVGGTKLVRDEKTARGWSETVWSKGGSSCSLSIAKPAYQTASPCANRASADVAAVGDPGSGVAVYHSRSGGGGWIVVGGTSAATPLVAGIFASTGHARRSTSQLAELVAGAALHDVLDGSNGSCGSKLCKAETGWDGPTGFGTPNAAALARIVLPDPVSPDADTGPRDDDKSDEAASLESPASAGCSTAGGDGGAALVLLAVGALFVRRRSDASAR